MSQQQEQQQQTGTSDTDSVNRFNDYGETHLISAVKTGDVVHIMNLVALGANVNTPDGNGWTPLHYAVEQGNIRISRFLLYSGADLEARTSYQETPLIVAAQTAQNMHMVYGLLRCGANMAAQDDEGHCITSYLSESEIVQCRKIWNSYDSSPARAM